MSRSNPLGLAPEAVEFEDGHLRPHKDADYSILRPEIVESIYLMYAVTKKRVYREWGRVMWEGIMRSGTLQNRALTSTFNMNGHRPRHKNKLHSFVLAETLKYFYLLFKDEGYGKKELFLKNFVFNTEAHPVRVRLTPPGLRPYAADSVVDPEKSTEETDENQETALGTPLSVVPPSDRVAQKNPAAS
eukprot:IDg6022t1